MGAGDIPHERHVCYSMVLLLLGRVSILLLLHNSCHICTVHTVHDLLLHRTVLSIVVCFTLCEFVTT